MKKLLASLGVGLLMLGITSAATPDTQLLEQLSGTTAVQNLKFTQAKSCKSLESMLEKYAKEARNNSRSPFMKRMGMMLTEDAAVTNEMAPQALDVMSSSSTDFSQTNIQKSWVDEPEILKTDGKYFYYYNQETKKISILSSPLDLQKAKLNPEKLALVKEIAVPQDLDQVELFLAKDRLVLMGTLYTRFSSFQSRFTWLNSDIRTVVAVYDTSDLAQLKLLKFENLPGFYEDARLIEDQLYVIAEQGINRWNWKGQEHDFRKAFAHVEITPQGKKSYPLECDQISYVLPEDKNLSLDPVFTLIFAMDIRDTSKKAETTALLAPNGEIHMTKDALYLVSDFYTQSNWSCPRGMLCAVPYFRTTTQTMIHKFSRHGLALRYQNTALVPWSLLTQYSMDEDDKGYFRILTKMWDPKLSTQLYVFNPDLTLAGKLENIEPGEEFKSSRYIGDKLYLVTFEQIDPLFVIDLVQPTQPKIIGELKIPGYSTYLHPLKKEGTKQYLVGLGYATTTNQWWGVTNSGVKLSLFQIDYAKKQGELIDVKELDSLVQGGKNSDSQALSNPRLFVMDKKWNITLPLKLVSWSNQGENCTITYDIQGKEQKKNCSSILEPSSYFLGLKTFSVSPQNGIKEVFAKDYLQAILAKKGLSITGDFQKIQRELWDNDEIFALQNMRVGYAGDALYAFTNFFADFIFPNKSSKTLWFK